MNLQQREAARLATSGKKDKEICRRIGIHRSSLRRWRMSEEFIAYAADLEKEIEREAIAQGVSHRADKIEVSAPDGVDVNAEIKAISKQAVQILRDLIHDSNPRVALSASIQVLALSGHVPPARKPSVQPSDAVIRRGNTLARMGEMLDLDEGREKPQQANEGADGPTEAGDDTTVDNDLPPDHL
jgi:hypothetical protein